MNRAYDYVQIVIDDDWGLIEIVPSDVNKNKTEEIKEEPTTKKEIPPQKLSQAITINENKIKSPITVSQPIINLTSYESNDNILKGFKI